MRRSFSLRISIYGIKINKRKYALALFYLVFKSEHFFSFFLKAALIGLIYLDQHLSYLIGH